MRNVYTQFPYAVDDRIYFQDINLSQLTTKTNFETYLANSQYTDASAELNNANIDFFGASVLNLLENRLVAIENYLLTLIKPQLTAYQSTEPTGVGVGFTWIED